MSSDEARLALKTAEDERHIPSPLPPPPPSTIACHYGSDVLYATGPLLPAAWSVPDAVRDALVAGGEDVPEPVIGSLLIDTGASITCISLGAAEKLMLRPSRVTRSYGASGVHDNPVFFVRLSVRVRDEDGQATTVTWEQEVKAIPELDNILGGGLDTDLVGLLGRDILRWSKLVYDGVEGTIDITFDVDALSGSPSR